MIISLRLLGTFYWENFVWILFPEIIGDIPIILIFQNNLIKTEIMYINEVPLSLISLAK